MAATAVESATAANIAATFVAATDVATTFIPTTVVATTVVPARSVSIGIPARIIATVAVISAVIPRASANEDAVEEPVGPIVAVRSAGIGIVVVVAVGARRRAICDGRTVGANPDAYRNLSV